MEYYPEPSLYGPSRERYLPADGGRRGSIPGYSPPKPPPVVPEKAAWSGQKPRIYVSQEFTVEEVPEKDEVESSTGDALDDTVFKMNQLMITDGSAKSKSKSGHAKTHSRSKGANSRHHRVQIKVPSNFENGSTGFFKDTYVKCQVKAEHDSILDASSYWYKVRGHVEDRVTSALEEDNPAATCEEKARSLRSAERAMKRYYNTMIGPRQIKVIYTRSTATVNPRSERDDLTEILLLGRRAADRLWTSRSGFVDAVNSCVSRDVGNKVDDDLLTPESVHAVRKSVSRQLQTRFIKFRETYKLDSNTPLPAIAAGNGYKSYYSNSRHRSIFADSRTNPDSKVRGYLHEDQRDTLVARIPADQIDQQDDEYLYIPLRDGWQSQSQHETKHELEKAITLDVDHAYGRALIQSARDVVIKAAVREARNSMSTLMNAYKASLPSTPKERTTPRSGRRPSLAP
ncbi:hypothetical protein I302_102646 [Kwoniella bestiolae CBS 10118]|uniref:Uncharacterized protein n=1 Tax=Kwoniella bestiolae CBS 10118 TaxID=1296100 RepID=A0A1B9GFJ8_9TREE|nr:hypothetical protein I302_01336 [Kwoniella bestiolae CBS 10118]OCF29823.1 hypothetical protein I302_01336 [Kwoniella bestiolae CBS 10118]